MVLSIFNTPGSVIVRPSTTTQAARLSHDALEQRCPTQANQAPHVISAGQDESRHAGFSNVYLPT